MYTQLGKHTDLQILTKVFFWQYPGVLTKGTIIEVNVSELGLVTAGGKVVWGRWAQITNNCENDGCINAYVILLVLHWWNLIPFQCSPGLITEWAACLSCCGETTEAVAHFHSRQVLRCSLQPGNLLDGELHMKLADFEGKHLSTNGEVVSV